MPNTKKPRMKRLISFVMAGALVLAAIAGALVFMPDTANAGTTDKLKNLTGAGVTSGDCFKLADVDGNNHVLTDVSLSEFTYSADVVWNSGTCTSLIFGSKSSDYTKIVSDGNNFFGIEFAKDGSNIKVKMFQDGGAGEFINQFVAATGVDFSKPVHVEIAVNATEELTIKINGNTVVYSFASGKDFKAAYNGGYLGMLTWDAAVTYYNVLIKNGAGTVVPVTSTTGRSLVRGSVVLLSNNGGNNLAMSESQGKVIDYEADVAFKSGANATFAFGAGSSDPAKCGNGTPNTFYGLELSHSSSNLNLKLFQDGPSAIGDNMLNATVAGGYDASKSVHLKLSIDKDNNIKIFIDGKEVSYTANTDKMALFRTRYEGGYLGFLTWNTAAEFSDVTYTTYDADNFATNLSGWSAIGGSWNNTSTGLASSASGDGFYMSNNTGSDFIYEADVDMTSGSGASSVVFRCADKSNPAAGSYVANIIYGDKARIFVFPGGADLGTFSLAGETKKTYHIKVVAVGSHIDYYLDGNLIISAEDTRYSGGYFGLLNYNGSMTFQNVNKTDVTGGIPKLTGLAVTGSDLPLSPSFDEDTRVYSVYAGSASSITVTPTADEGTELKIAYSDNSGNVIEAESAIASETSKTLSVPAGISRVVISAKKNTLTLDTVINVTRNTPEEVLAAQAYRCQLHFSPEINFMNDPNGLVFDPTDGANGRWHMFFQYSPQVNQMGSQTWGHAVSDDLTHWEYMPLALPMDSLGAIFSGCMVIDENNTSGFFTDNEEGDSKLVAIFTHAGSTGQQQSIAYSTDHGATWTKYDGNPVIPNLYGEATTYGNDFRDPKVYWHDGQWMMVVAGGHARLFGSKDLKTWEVIADLGMDSECPDFFRLTLDEATDTVPAGEYWVYSAGGEWYQLGTLSDNGTTASGLKKYAFTKVGGTIASPNGQTAMYASQSYYTDEELSGTQTRRLMVSWLQDYSAPLAIPSKTWNGDQSLPLEMKLINVDGSVTLSHYPAAEVDDMRSGTLYHTANTVVAEDDANILEGVAAQYYDVEGVFTLGTASSFGFKLRTGNGEETILRYDVASKQMVLDKSNSGVTNKGILSWKLVPMEGNKIQLRAVVDNSVIETFGNYGEANISDLYFPSPASVGMEFFTTGGNVTIDSLDIYEMDGIFDEGTEPQSIYVGAPEYVDPNTTFTVNATVLPLSVNAATNVQWEVIGNATVIDSDTKELVLQSTGVGAITIKAKTLDGSIENGATVQVVERKFETNLENYKATGGSWNIVENGLLANNAGSGDMFYVSDSFVGADVPFTLEADVTLMNGRAAGILLGVTDRNNPASHWYCLNVDTGENSCKFFKNTGGQNWNYPTAKDASNIIGKVVNLKVEYDGIGTFKVYIDNALTRTVNDTGWQGGYVGVMSFMSKTVFDNVYLTVSSEITAILSTLDPIYALPGELDSTKIMDLLPKQLKVKNALDVVYLADVADWDIAGVDYDTPGTYSLIAEIAGTDLGMAQILIVREPVSGIFVTGDAKTGETLTANILPDTATVKYQWQISDDPAGTFTDIAGETNATLLVDEGYVGRYIRVKADGIGAYCGAMASLPTAMVERSYDITKGDGDKWYNLSKDGIEFVANGDYASFVENGRIVLVDGKPVDQDDFDSKSGSTIVTLKNDYLKSLALGEHTIEIVFLDGSANGTFIVTDVAPKTLDGIAFIAIPLMMMSMAALAMTASYKKYRNARAK